MVKLNFPEGKFKIYKSPDGVFIFDLVRKKQILLTPEEWVRQHLINYLNVEKNYPLSLMKLEMQLNINNLKRRPDLVVYSKQGNPIFIGECKAPNIGISQDVFEQIAQYNIALKVPYLLVTNGMNHYQCKVDHQSNKITFLQEIPSYDEL